MQTAVSVDIEAPVELVWAMAQDAELRPLWDYRIARYVLRGPLGQGTEIDITFRAGLLRPTSHAVLLVCQPPHKTVLRTLTTSTSWMPVDAGSWTFTPTGSGTNFTSRFNLETEKLPPYVWKWLMLKLVEWDTRRSFRRLRRLVLSRLAQQAG